MGEANCRCCWAKLDAESISFHLNVKEASDGLALRDKLTQCIPEIKISEKPEDVICVNCFASLTSAYNFRKMCLRTDEKLREKERAMEIVDASVATAMLTEEGEANERAGSVLDGSVNSEFDESVGSELDCGVILNTLPIKVLNVAIDGNAISVCDRCKSLFLRREHYLSHDCQGADSCRKCYQCNVSFRSNTIYEMHMKFMHSQLYSTYKLNDTINRKQFVINSDVESPSVQIKARESTKVSSKTATSKQVKKTVDADSSKSHKKKKEVSVKGYKCLFCKKCCSTSSNLQRHFIVHKAYCYRCLRCDRLEVNKAHHKIKCECTDFALPTFTDTRCPFCFKHFPTVAEFEDHLSAYKDFKKYCFTCYMQFDSIWETALHHISTKCGTSQLVTNVVMKGNTFSCPVCKKNFSSKSNLLAHFRNHRANTTVCSRCNIPFYNSVLYEEHHESCNKLSDASMKTEEIMIKEEIRESCEDKVSTLSTKEEPASLGDLHVVEETETLQEVAKEETTVTGGSLEQNDEETITTNHDPEIVQTISEPKSSETVEEMMVNIESIMNKVGEQLQQLAESHVDEAEIDREVNTITSVRETEDEVEMVTSTT